MNVEQLRNFALSFPGVEESFPFGPDTLVFKVSGKIFLLLSLNSDPLQFNVKCDPEEAILLRERYEEVQPGYHMNKKHWNTVVINSVIPKAELQTFITNSYQLVSPIRSKT